MIPGSRRWLAFSDPSTWRIAYDRDIQRGAISRKALAHGRTFRVESLERTVSVCWFCGGECDPADDPAPIDGCERHGQTLEVVRLWRPVVALSVSWPLAEGATHQVARMVEAGRRAS